MVTADILLVNLYQPKGSCNDIRLTFARLINRVIEDNIILSKSIENIIYISKISIYNSQFPITLVIQDYKRL